MDVTDKLRLNRTSMRSWVVVVTLVLVGSSPGMAAQCADEQRAALRELYEATSGASWANNEGWDVGSSNSNFCSGWHGVSCWFGCEVTKLSLNSNALAGTLPESLCSLSQLRQVWLSENALSGSLPSGLGCMTQMTQLRASENALSGTLADTLIGLTALQTLVISSNSISGSVPGAISSLGAIRTLTIAGNVGLSGQLPVTMGLLVNLSSLSLSVTSISGSIPHVMGSLTRLMTLYLNQMSLSGTLPGAFGVLTSLKVLVASNNQLSGTFPPALKELSGLGTLMLSQAADSRLSGNSSLSGTIPESISSLTAMVSLLLGYNTRLSGQLPVGIGSLVRVSSLALQNTAISGSIPHALGSLTRLVIGYVSSTRLSGTLPSTVGGLTAMEKLFSMQNRLSGTLAFRAGSLASLRFFFLNSNRLSGSLPSTVQFCTNLRLLNLASNSLSGSMPASLGVLTGLGRLYLFQNSFSGSIPSAFSVMSSMKQVLLQANKLSSTLPSGLGSLTSLEWLFLSQQFISGSLPFTLGSLTALEYFDVSQLRLEGSSSDSFSTWEGLKFLSVFGNHGLDFHLDLLESYGQLEHGLLQNCAINGALPPFTTPSTKLVTLLLHQNYLTGTIARQFFLGLPSLSTLSLSNNHISGSLPTELGQQSSLSAFLANQNRLSGTLPDGWNTRRSGNVPVLETISLARNYLRGSIPELASATDLKTLVVSSNYLSCQAPELNDATNLAIGSFREPGQVAIETAGQQVYQISYGYDPIFAVNPYEGYEVESFANIALVFSGNSELTTSAASLPLRAAGNLLRSDRVREGRHGLFVGHDAFNQLVLVLLPSLFVTHFAVVALSIMQYPGCGLKLYLKTSRALSSRCNTQRDVIVNLLQESWPTMALSALAGLALLVLNGLSRNLYDHNGCIDPLIELTIAPIEADQSSYSCCWAVLAIAGSTTAAALTERLLADSRTEAAKSLLFCLSSFTAGRLSPAAEAVITWRGNSIAAPSLFSRRLLYWICHVPVLIGLAIPSFMAVLVINVSSKQLFDGAEVLGNALVVTLLNTALSLLLVPSATKWLVRLKYGGSVAADDPMVVHHFKTQVNTSLIFETVTTVLTPMIAVFVLHESCLRQYLQFDPDLHSLLEAWGIGETGTSAFRRGFCSRALLTDFGYFWISMVLVKTLLASTIRLLLALPMASQVRHRLEECKTRLCGAAADPAPYAVTREAAFKVQRNLVNVLTTMMVAVVFGALVPWLLLLVPMGLWLQFCAERWCFLHSSELVGSILARQVLVQLPLRSFQVALLLLSWAVGFFVLWDLQLGLAGMVLFSCLILAQVAVLCLLRCYYLHRGRCKKELAARGAEESGMAPSLVTFAQEQPAPVKVQFREDAQEDDNRHPAQPTMTIEFNKMHTVCISFDK